MKNDEIIEKIKKLLRMKNGGSLAEVQTALDLAQKLADKHNIDINSIDENEPAKEPVTHESIKLNRLQFECKYAALIVESFFHVDVVAGGGLTFIGTKTNILIARYVYNFLIKRFRYEWKTKRGRLRNRQAFMYGMFQALYYKLHSMRVKPLEQEGLVLAGDKLQRKNYIQEHWGKTTTSSVKPDHDASTARWRGMEAGRNININSAVTTSADKNLLKAH